MEPVNAVIKYYEKSFQVPAAYSMQAPVAARRPTLFTFERR
jgi:hypothetical protein